MSSDAYLPVPEENFSQTVRPRRILATPLGGVLAHVSRTLEVARALRAMGHEVLFAGTGKYMELPRSAGFTICPLIDLDVEATLKVSRSGRVNFYSYPEVCRYVEAERQLLAEIQPDAVLIDFRLSMGTSCELAGIPSAVLLNAAWTNYYTAPLRPPEHLTVTRLLGRRLTALILPWVKDALLNEGARPFQRFRREQGVPPRGNIFDVWRGDLNLLTDIPEYGPTAGLPSDFHYVGPVVWEPDLPVPEWLDRLDLTRPVLYFSMGSTGNARFFQQAVDLFANSEYQCVLTTAGFDNLGTVPENFFVTDYAPGSRIMEKADLVICHGGNGTIYQAMIAGVPIVGIPTMHDQEFNLDRVVALGVGIHLSELHFRPEHLKNAVRKVLETPAYREATQRLCSILAKYDGPRTAARLIDALVNGPKTNAAS